MLNAQNISLQTSVIADGATLAVDLIANCQIPLLPSEVSLALGATPARVRELQAGRATARYAICHLGGNPEESILSGPTGAPAWPAGFCGSLSHTSQRVAALVARTSQFDSVGVDIDDGRPLGNAVVDIATSSELHLVDVMSRLDGGSRGCLVFSIKEAIFKCQCPITLDESLEFLDILLVPGGSPGTLAFRVIKSNRPLLTRLSAHMLIGLHTNLGVTAAYALLPNNKST